MFPEVLIFAKYALSIDDRNVLDLGVGSGRTLRHLQPRAANYFAVDYSDAAIKCCRQRFPEAADKILLDDARDLGRFESNYFNFVLFSFNGIDTVEHQDRIRILAEVHRVLAEGGLFAFSSHDLDSVGSPLRQLLRSRILSDPRNLLDMPRIFAAAGRLVRRVANRTRNRQRQRWYPDHAMLNDSALEFACLHYYISEKAQKSQLVAHGFEPLATYPDTGDTPSSIYYVARKLTT